MPAIPVISAFVRARGDHFTRSAVLLADSPPEAEDVVLEVAEPANPAIGMCSVPWCGGSAPAAATTPTT